MGQVAIALLKGAETHVCCAKGVWACMELISRSLG